MPKRIRGKPPKPPVSFDLTSISEDVFKKSRHRKGQDAFDDPTLVEFVLTPFHQSLNAALESLDKGNEGDKEQLRKAVHDTDLNLKLRLQLLDEMHAQLSKEVTSAVLAHDHNDNDNDDDSEDDDSDLEEESTLDDRSAVAMIHENLLSILNRNEKEENDEKISRWRFLDTFGAKIKAPPEVHWGSSIDGGGMDIFDPQYLHTTVPRQNNSVLSFIDAGEIDEDTGFLTVNPFEKSLIRELMKMKESADTPIYAEHLHDDDRDSDPIRKYLDMVKPEIPGNEILDENDIEYEVDYVFYPDIVDEMPSVLKANVDTDANARNKDESSISELESRKDPISEPVPESVQDVDHEKGNRINMNEPLPSAKTKMKSKSKATSRTFKRKSDFKSLLLPSTDGKIITSGLGGTTVPAAFILYKGDAIAHKGVAFPMSKLFNQSFTFPGVDITELTPNLMFSSPIPAKNPGSESQSQSLDDSDSQPQTSHSDTSQADMDTPTPTPNELKDRSKEERDDLATDMPMAALNRIQQMQPSVATLTKQIDSVLAAELKGQPGQKNKKQKRTLGIDISFSFEELEQQIRSKKRSLTIESVAPSKQRVFVSLLHSITKANNKDNNGQFILVGDEKTTSISYK